jgi:hypothetical protein
LFYLFGEGQFGLPESEYTTLLKSVQHINYSIENQIVLLAIVDYEYTGKNNLDFAKINNWGPDDIC